MTVGSQRSLRRLAALAALCACLPASGCSTGPPPPIDAQSLAEAQTFPYFKVYWVGTRFGAFPLTAADGKKSYISSIGESVYYGDCVHGKGVFQGGSCVLPLQVTTVVYRRHSNTTLGAQRNALIRGVPAVIYDNGRSIELYSGRVAIDVFSNNLVNALRAAALLRPLNAPGSAAGPLAPPIYCPGLSGPIPAAVGDALANLPGRACQRARAAEAELRALTSAER